MLLRAFAVLFAAPIAAFVSGCAGDTTTTFPDGLKPLGENKAAYPPPKDGDPFPESIQFQIGSTEEFDWAHARAFVHASLADTWKALRDPDVSTDRTHITSLTVERDVEPEYAFSYRIHNVVEDVVTVEFENTWRHDAAEGTVEAPEVVIGAYQKTWGSTYIDLMRGSVVARPVSSEVTELDLQEEISADFQGPQTAVDTISLYYWSVLAFVAGKPLP
jgi:hypothetical protein